jgi:hypothetical protein
MGPVTTQEKGPQYSENRRLVDPRVGLDALEYKNLLFLLGILGCLVSSRVIISTTLYWLHHGCFGIAKQHAFYKNRNK